MNMQTIASYNISIMSVQDKQQYLRDAVLGSGITPNQFFEYWESLELELEEVPFEQLKQIVQDFMNEHRQHQKQPQNQEQDDFDDFQEAEQKENANQEYTDYNWDYLKASPPKTHKVSQQPQQIAKEQQPVIKADSKKPDVQKRSQPKKEKQAEATTSNNSKNERHSVNLIDGDLGEAPSVKEKIQEQRAVSVREVLQKSKLNKIKCLQLQANVLQHHANVQIAVSKGEMVEDKNSGFIDKLIKSTKYQFIITTLARNRNRSVGLSWEVKRTNLHFEWLKNTLIKFYPGIVVPPLPQLPKNPQKLAAYRTKLEHFLIDCYRCPELRNSKYYEVFLSYNYKGDLEGFMKKSEGMGKPKSLAHILNMEGSVETLFSDSIEQYGLGLQSFLNRSSQHLQQVRKVLGEINEHYLKIVEGYKHLGSVFMEMSDQSCQFSKEKCYQRLTSTYKQVAVVAGEHSGLCEQERQQIDAYMTSHFAYEKDRLENMQGLINKRTQFAAELAQRPKDSDSKGMFGKIASFFGEKAEEVDSPSSNYETLRAQVGFYNSQLLRESVRMVGAMAESHVEHFSGYGMTRIDSVDKLQQQWSQLMVELSKLNVDK